MEQSEYQANHGTILKELSDIKASLAVNTSETANIKISMIDIKTDMREIKADFVTRREFNDAIKTIRDTSPNSDFEDRLRMLEKFRWQFAGGMSLLIAVADYILYFVLKK